MKQVESIETIKRWKANTTTELRTLLSNFQLLRPQSWRHRHCCSSASSKSASRIQERKSWSLGGWNILWSWSWVHYRPIGGCGRRLPAPTAARSAGKSTSSRPPAAGNTCAAFPARRTPLPWESRSWRDILSWCRACIPAESPQGRSSLPPPVSHSGRIKKWRGAINNEPLHLLVAQVHRLTNFKVSHFSSIEII